MYSRTVPERSSSKIEEEFGNAISAGEKKAIATLIYYPEQKLEQVLKTEEKHGGLV